jgi:hypothetical protein
MSTEGIIVICYLAIGVALMSYWWSKSYQEEYEKAKKSGELIEDNMATLLLLCMTFFWPLVLIWKFINYITE